MALFVAELKKLTSRSFGFWLVIAMLILKLAYLGLEDTKTNSFILENKAEYLSIVNRYTGKIYQSVSNQIESENAQVLRASDELRQLRIDYNDGKLSKENFERDLPVLEKLVNNKELFLYFYSQYLNVNTEPENRYILFTEGWDRFFSTTRFDWFSALVIIIFAALVFGKEYEADMQRLQISTPSGDINLFFTKCLVLLVIVLGINLLSFTVEFSFFHFKYGLPNWEFPYQSISAFQNSALPLSLHQATILTFFIRLFGMCILGIITMAVSVASQSIIQSLLGGLALIAIPFALPVTDALKVFLPSPYSLIIGTSFLYGSNTSPSGNESFSLTQQLTNGHILGVLAFWIIVISILLLYIRRKFGYVRYAPHKGKNVILLCLILIPLLFGCRSPQSNNQEELTFNFGNDPLYAYSEPYAVSLYPTFMIEDTRTGHLEKVIRDPFLDKAFIDKNISGIFIHDDDLFYAISTHEYEQIRSVNLITWETKELFTRYPQRQVSLLNDDLETHFWSLGKSLFPFMIYEDDLYFLSEDELFMVERGSSRQIPIIKQISPQGGLSFKDGEFYYISKVNELRVFSLSDKTDHPLFGIRAIYQLFINGDHLYYLNLDKGLSLYSLNLITNEISQVLKAEIGYYACDDKYVYFSDLKDKGCLYRVDLSTGERKLLAQINNVLNVQTLEGKPYLYFRAADSEDYSTITYKISKENWSVERLITYEDFDQSLK